MTCLMIDWQNNETHIASLTISMMVLVYIHLWKVLHRLISCSKITEYANKLQEL